MITWPLSVDWMMKVQLLKEVLVRNKVVLFVFVGEVTSFFTEKDRGIAADLLDFLRGAHEEIPEWLENLARETNNDDYLYEI